MKSSLVKNMVTKPWFAFVIITIVGLVVYSNIYQVPFVFDGVYRIEDNGKIRDLKNYFSPGILLSPRPLVEFTFALNYKFGKLNVFGYHLVNVVIHIINGLLVYFLALNIFKLLMNPPGKGLRHLARQMSDFQGPKSEVHGPQSAVSQSTIDNRQSSIYWMSLFTALIFIAHPLQTQAVTYTVQRYTSMASMFYFLAIICYVRGRVVAESSKIKAQSSGRQPSSVFSFQLLAYFTLSFVCGVLAFLSKQNTASLPAAILLTEYMLFDRTWQGWKKKLIWFAPFIVLMGVFILYVSGLFTGGLQFGSLLEDVSDILRAPETEVSRWIYLCTQFNVVAIYIQLLFFPVGQNLDWLYPFKSGFFDGYTPLAFLFLIAVVAVGILSIKKRPVITFGIFWFFITLSIESSILPITDALFEHRLYLPMFGFAIVVAYSMFYLLPVKACWSVVISVLIVVFLGTGTYLRNQIWQNPESLWSDVVCKGPENFRAHYNMGNALYHGQQLDKAIDSYFKALGIKPDFAVAHDNLGVALFQNGRVDEAMTHFSRALHIKPHNSKMLTNYGNALMQQGKLKDAMSHFSRALKIDSNNVEARNNFGIALAQQGNLKDAIVQLSKALRIQPHNAKIHFNFGQVAMLQGHLQKAALYFSEAVRIKPEYAEAHNNLGVVLVRQGDVDSGIEHFSKALKINPGLNQARQWLNRALRLKATKNPPYRR